MKPILFIGVEVIGDGGRFPESSYADFGVLNWEAPLEPANSPSELIEISLLKPI